ncbi:maltose O-acetyltransferase [Pedobacter cryoconitis]|uniref:Maltose O-acetyltransferase n=1 Tax=Pedobacter cryoconitis TaxID=188932 RepID=A0A7W9DZ33_9SPHI|nr:acyltransferase [Pedobacter cryoconitis]MBB5636591.1 maltose O-acetyltransferase [Pedobacter cryoconitis]
MSSEKQNNRHSIISLFGYACYMLVKNLFEIPPYKLNIVGSLRIFFARLYIRSCGKGVAIERGASFSRKLTLGDHSGVGRNAWVRGEVTIGNYVLMAPNVVILTQNHIFDRIDIPILEQGTTAEKPVVIEDDCWICQNVIILPGITIGKGSVIAAGAVVTKNVAPYSIMGGNPAKLIKHRG